MFITKELKRLDIVFENVEVCQVPAELVNWASIGVTGVCSTYRDERPYVDHRYATKEMVIILHDSAKDIESVNMPSDTGLLDRLRLWKDIASVIFVYDDGSEVCYDVPYFGMWWYYNNHFQKIERDRDFIHIFVGKRFVKMPILGYLKDVFKVKIVIPIKEYWRKITRWKRN